MSSADVILNCIVPCFGVELIICMSRDKIMRAVDKFYANFCCERKVRTAKVIVILKY